MTDRPITAALLKPLCFRRTCRTYVPMMEWKYPFVLSVFIHVTGYTNMMMAMNAASTLMHTWMENYILYWLPGSCDDSSTDTVD